MASTSDTLLLSLSSLVLPKGAYVTAPRMDLHATSFTVATKVLLDNVNDRNIVLGNWGAAQNSWQLLFAINAGGTIQVDFRRDMVTNGSNPAQGLASVSSTVPVKPGAWHHVAVTWDWADINHPKAVVYLDGAPVGSVTATVDKSVAGLRNPYTLMPSSNPYLIGKKEDGSDSSHWFSGQMQNFRVYCSALNAAEILALAAS